jgi:hypothetical protein
LELSQESRQRLISAFEEIPSGYAAVGQAIEERRAKWEEMVSNEKELSEAQRDSWFKVGQIQIMIVKHKSYGDFFYFIFDFVPTTV